MIDKIKALSDKKMMLIGIILIVIAIIFFLVISFAYAITSSMWIDFIYSFLTISGFIFMAMAHKKKAIK